MAETKKYEVKILNAVGSCDSNIFRKMASKGDINAIKIFELLNAEVSITGYAKCQITTDEKDFCINYFATEEYGIISSGSEIFFESVVDYYEDVDTVEITEIKTKKGKTYKAIPVFTKKENKEEETEN